MSKTETVLLVNKYTRRSATPDYRTVTVTSRSQWTIRGTWQSFLGATISDKFDLSTWEVVTD